MPKLSKEVVAIGKAMTPRQWNTLRALAMFPFYMSAAERGDPELYALVRNKLAQCFSSVPPGTSALFGWQATALGKSLLKRRDAGQL